MSKAIVADNKPKAINLKKGEDYFWCSCGKSANQPFCDGSHRGTDFVPKKFTAEKLLQTSLRESTQNAKVI